MSAMGEMRFVKEGSLVAEESDQSVKAVVAVAADSPAYKRGIDDIRPSER